MAKSKVKNFPQMTLAMWKELIEPRSPLLAEIFENPTRCDDILVQLGSSVHNGVLAASPPSFRAEILHFFERNCRELCKSSNENRLRHVYESFRDHLGVPARDGPKIASQLRDSAMKSLTTVLILLDLPRKDPRLTKFHIELLYRLLLGRDSGTTPVAGTAVQDALQDRRFLAVECLQMLENAYPTLLSVDASAFVALAVSEATKNPTPGFLYTQLAASVVSHVATMYLCQQEEYTALSYEMEDHVEELEEELEEGGEGFGEAFAVAAPATTTGKSPSSVAAYSDSDDDENGTEEVLTAAADALCVTGASRTVYDAEDDLEVEFSHHHDDLENAGNDEDNRCNNAAANVTADSSTLATPSGGAASLISPGGAGEEEQQPRSNKSLLTAFAARASDSSETSSPRAIVRSAGPSSSTASIPSKQSSKRSMLASVAEADELGCSSSSRDRSPPPPPEILQCQSSALTFQLRRTTSLDTESSTSGTGGGGSNAQGGLSWSAATTPRALHTELILLQPTGETTSLRRYTVPLHIQTGDSCDMPRLVMNAEANAAMQAAATTFINSMRRLNPAAVARMTKALPPILRCARPSPTLLWPLFERQLSTGSTPLLRAVLDLHDALPELFEGRAPSLIEKVLAQVNDRMHSTDHRVVGASWVLRQHAMQRHSGGTLLLADSWEQLLPRAYDPPQLAAIKVKALGACLAAGVGDEEVVCRAVCSWEGFFSGNTKTRSKNNNPSEQQLRAFTYALRILHSSAPPDGPAAYRTHACLIAGILEAIAARPQLVPAVDTFLETCSDQFSGIFLKAIDAFFSGVDGQFESLKERPEDVPFQGTTVDLADRVKAAVISRSSSLSGLMRGLSFSLSFSKRSHSFLPSSGNADGHHGGGGVKRTMSVAVPSSVPGTPRSSRSAAVPVVDVRALRSSISAAFQQQEQEELVGSTTKNGLGFSSAMSEGGTSTVGDVFAALADGQASPCLSAATPRGGMHSLDFSTSTWSSLQTRPQLVAPTVPLDLPTQEAVEMWLSSPSTWESLSVGILQHDLMAYRLILKRALRSTVYVHPRGILRTIANYTWQYKEHHPSHTLYSAKATGNALLGLCHVAALAHLPCRFQGNCGGGGGGSGGGWTLRQSEVAESIQNALDAIEEGFPVAEVQSQCQVLAAAVVAQEAAWVGSALGDTLHNLLESYVDSAVQG